MVSIELGDMEHIAQKYCDGNLSRYLRQLIQQDHLLHTTQQKNSITLFLFQFIIYSSIGLTFLVISFSLIFPILIVATLILSFISGIVLLLYGTIYVYYFKYKKMRGDLRES